MACGYGEGEGFVLLRESAREIGTGDGCWASGKVSKAGSMAILDLAILDALS